VLVNTDNTPSNARNIFGKIALVVMKKGSPDKSDEELFDINLERCIGTYTVPGINDEIYIQLNDNDMHLYYTTDTLTMGEKLYNLGDGRFWTQNWPLDAIIFDFKKNDEVVGLREYYTGQYGLTREKVN
jgi:hypothetical protein